MRSFSRPALGDPLADQIEPLIDPSTRMIVVSHLHNPSAAPLASADLEALARLDFEPIDGDILVVAQKIVSKAEGQQVRLSEISPSSAARELATEVDKDPRLVELILQESTAVIRRSPGVLIVRNRLGIRNNFV